MPRTYIGISRKRERGREEKIKSRDLSKQGDREWRTYIGIDIRKTSLKTDGETESGDPTYGSLERGREEDRKRARAEI